MYLVDFIFDLLCSAPPGESLADISSELYQVPVTFTRNSSEDSITQVSQHATLWEEPEEVLSRSINTQQIRQQSQGKKGLFSRTVPTMVSKKWYFNYKKELISFDPGAQGSW